MVRKSNILIVDDDEMNCKALQGILNINGYENVDYVTSPFKALRKLGVSHLDNKSTNIVIPEEQPTQKYSLVLLDVMMPGMNGYEACHLIKEHCKLPVILITAIAEVDEHVKGIEAGADDILVKPAPIKKMLARINLLLQTHTRQHQVHADYENLKKLHDTLPPYIRKEKDYIDKYRVKTSIGSGTTSTVYHVTDPDDNEYALKIMKSEITSDANNIERFRHETEILSQLDHPNLLKVIDYGIDSGHPYVVTELTSCTDLADWVKRMHNLTMNSISHIAKQLADVLDYIHSRDIIHRDIKPENILYCPEKQHIYLVDFGLSFQEGIPTSNECAGTPAYMAPEIFIKGKWSQSSDVYAYGITLFYLLAGKLPFNTKSISEMIHLHCTTDVPDLRQFREDLKPGWYELTNACLNKNPKHRPPDIGNFTGDFDQNLF